MEKNLIVGFITTYPPERCGIAEYAANLVASVGDVDFRIISPPADLSTLARDLDDVDVIHLNHETGLFAHLTDRLPKLIKGTGKPSVLTLHCSQEGDNRSAYTDCFTAVVVHERTVEGFAYIPQGIPNILAEEDLAAIPTEDLVGESGFPFGHKGFLDAALGAAQIGCGFLAVAADSRHANPETLLSVLRSENLRYEVRTDYLSQRDVTLQLARCKILAYPYRGDLYGISGAVRQGLATRRPIVVSRSRQFRDICEEYEDEIGIVDTKAPTGEQVASAMRDTLSCGKHPVRILDDMSWEKSGRKYLELYRSLV